MLVELGHQQNYRIWGNDLDMSEQSHALGYLMWLQYHCSLVFLKNKPGQFFWSFFFGGGGVWFGVSTNGLGWWFGILGVPLNNNPFHQGISNIIQTTCLFCRICWKPWLGLQLTKGRDSIPMLQKMPL